MGQGMDICLAVDAGSASPQEHLEARFVRCLVCQAGIVLAGRKPSAVFGFRMPPDDAARPTSMCRLRAYYNDRTPFPHEIGFVLGYPIEDVDGFMSDGGQGARACGRWKVYGDVDEALRRFKELEREELRIKRLYSEGTPLRGLLRMATA